MDSLLKRMAIFSIVLGVVCALFLNYERHLIESANSTVETIIENEPIERMGRLNGMDKEGVLKLFQAKGALSVALYDYSLASIAQAGKVVAISGNDLYRDSKLGKLSPQWQSIVAREDFTVDAIYVTEGTSALAMGDLEEDLPLRIGKDRMKLIVASPKVYRISGEGEQFKIPDMPWEEKGIWDIPLGLSSDDIALADKMGFMVVARPRNYAEPVCVQSAPAQEQIASFFHRIDKVRGKVSGFCPAGKTILGVDGHLTYVADCLRERDIPLLMVEGVTQLQFVPTAGLSELAELLNYNVIRTYTIDGLEQAKLESYAAMRRWALSDKERNIRANLIRSFTTPRDGQDLLTTNLNYIGGVIASLRANNFTIGRASSYGVYFPQRGYLVFVALAIVSGIMLYLTLVVNLGRCTQYALALLLALVVVWGAVWCYDLRMRQLLAVCAAVFFPVLAFYHVVQKWEEERGNLASDAKWSTVRIAMRAVRDIVLATLFSLIGAALLSAILGDIRFFLEMDIYRGVKLTFILPILLLLLLYISRHPIWEGDDMNLGLYARLSRFLRNPLTLKALLILAVLGVVVIIFIGRSGHTAGIPVPQIELKLRYFLEEVMYARPRGKEFLIGHPCFFLAAYACLKALPIPARLALAVGAMIGQASLVQTFAHMRTPVLMSYVRAANGLALGIVLGLVALGVLSLAYPYYMAWRKEHRPS